MQVDRLSNDIGDHLDNTGLVYAKFREITAVQADVPTPVETILGSGKFETGNVAQPGDWDRHESRRGTLRREAGQVREEL
jgi:hypothetical protein